MTRLGYSFSGGAILFAMAAVLGSPQSLQAEGKDCSLSPEILVEMAYAAELSGQIAVRDALVNQLLDRAPENEKVHWLAGQVREGDTWMSVPALEQKRVADETLQEYARRRETCDDDVDSKLRLANWCRDQRMTDRERFHLLEVATMQGGRDPAVMARLGMVKFQDRWVPKEDVDAYRRVDDEQRRLERKWRPLFASWKAGLGSDDSAPYEKLAERLPEVTDMEALPLLEDLLSAHSEKAALAVVAFLDTQSNQKATESLIRHAVFSKFDAVRAAAAEALKKRPKYNYVPILLAEMVDPMEFEVEYPYGNGGYRRTTAIQRGRDYDLKSVSHDFQYITREKFLAHIHAPRPWIERRLDATDQQAVAVKPGSYVESETPKTRRNAQLAETLYLLTGERFSEPEEWRDWWNDYTEYEEREVEKPTYERSAYRYLWSYSHRTACTCLAWGTPVATETGLRPVEQILPGDKVLAQDPDTGELDYRLIVQRTVRRLGEMRKISIGDDSVTVTLGHPFWVVGSGWQMAKELKVGQRVRCLGGSREVTTIEALPEDAAYNLVVDGFATYFAGNSRVLLHDNTLPKPTDAVLPGFVVAKP